MGVVDFFSNNLFTILIVAIIVLVCYMGTLWNNVGIYDDLLTGFWKSSADFLEEADLDSFILYMAPPNSGGVRACYILAEKDSELVINEPVSAKLKNTSGWSTGFGNQSYSAEFYDLETADFPANQKIMFYPKTGKIIMSKGDTIFGVFYKDAILTETIYSYDQLKPDQNDDDEDEDDDDEDDDE